MQSGLITHPRIKSKYHIEHVPGDGIFLLAENERHVLEGDSLLAIVPLIDGHRSWQEIVAVAGCQLSHEQANEAVRVLLDHGHVEQADVSIPPELQIFWSELGRDAASARALIEQTNVRLLTVGDVGRESLEAAIRSFGFPVDDRRPAALTIAAVDDYQAPELAELNRVAVTLGSPWALLKPSGLLPIVGPFFLPGRTACWECLHSRLRHNREVETYVQKKTGRGRPFPTTRTHIPLARMQAVSMALLQIVRWLATGSNPTLEGRITVLDVLAGQQTHHTVTRRPQCPACGDAAQSTRAGQPIQFADQRLTDRGENGFRSESPEVTYQRYAHHVSDLCGVVKCVDPSPWNQSGPLRTYVAGHNFALKNDGLFFIRDGLRSASSGKGKTDAQAKTSAICEALERFSGVYRGEEEVRHGAMTEFGTDAIDPTTVTMFSDRQYEDRERWLARGERFQVVPLPFDPEAAIDWSPVWSHTEQRTKWLPTGLLYYGHTDDGDDKFFCWGDSNGNAAGSTLEDATLQGFLELVERESVGMWWYNRVRRPEVDLDSLGDPYIDELRSFYAEHQRSFWVLDLTADLGIPAFAAINRRAGGPTEDIVLGFGAHLDARIGIMRALTEMNQFIPALLARNDAGETVYGFDDPASVHWWKTAKLENECYLQPSDDAPRSIEDLPRADTGDVLTHLQTCFDKVERKGMEVLILDQTRPDVGVPVVKVIVPGLRHFWARFAPGRLYDVPVELGWLDSPRSEADLNPTPMFV